jgi:hypothetical protein
LCAVKAIQDRSPDLDVVNAAITTPHLTHWWLEPVIAYLKTTIKLTNIVGIIGWSGDNHLRLIFYFSLVILMSDNKPLSMIILSICISTPGHVSEQFTLQRLDWQRHKFGFMSCQPHELLHKTQMLFLLFSENHVVLLVFMIYISVIWRWERKWQVHGCSDHVYIGRRRSHSAGDILFGR